VALLVQYFRHVVMARRLAQIIEDIGSDEGVDVDALGKLMTLQRQESAILRDIMVALTLTPKSVEPSRVSIEKLQRQPTPWRG
jgi:hypothetical protein